MSRSAKFTFRLYIAGGTQNSAQAVANLRALCRDHLPDQHDIEIVDVLKEPKRALKDAVFMTPTLIKLAPFPAQKFVGTLNQTDAVLRALDLEAVAT